MNFILPDVLQKKQALVELRAHLHTTALHRMISSSFHKSVLQS